MPALRLLMPAASRHRVRLPFGSVFAAKT